MHTPLRFLLQIDTGKPQAIDRAEPFKVAMSVKKMGLRYATVTGVAGDDLEDEGTWLSPRPFAASTS